MRILCAYIRAIVSAIIYLPNEEHIRRTHEDMCDISNYDSSSYIGIDAGREIIKKSRTEKRSVAIEPEGKRSF